ncbi:hypothetical protein D9C73_023254 [Collichthys lucidus]|uniref:Chromosomal protein D1-like n=1 Tax=Collichthys lucidus TaxID=240159 RepID=A0A4U5VJC4_COLLU|nr:hypothetical protein D9C73_023254 [Collichthys lucidus]
MTETDRQIEVLKTKWKKKMKKKKKRDSSADPAPVLCSCVWLVAQTLSIRIALQCSSEEGKKAYISNLCTALFCTHTKKRLTGLFQLKRKYSCHNRAACYSLFYKTSRGAHKTGTEENISKHGDKEEAERGSLISHTGSKRLRVLCAFVESHVCLHLRLIMHVALVIFKNCSRVFLSFRNAARERSARTVCMQRYEVEEEIQADGSSMEEESMAETEQGDAGSNGGESSMDMSNNNPPKRGRGRPQGSKKLKVCVTDVNLMELVSGISNGGSTQPHRGRGRPRLSKQIEQQGSGDDTDNSVQTPRRPGRPKGSKNQASNKDTLMTDHSPKKRGRPKKSLDKSTHEKVDDEDLPNGGSDTPKPGRGRPKGSTKRKMESLTSGGVDEGSSVTPRKRGRPKGSLNKTHRLGKEESSGGETDVDESLNSMKRRRGRLRKVEVNNTRESTQDTSNSISKVARRGRGRPRKNIEHSSRDKQGLITDGSQPVKRGRGRPKGSLNKKPPAYKVHGKVGRPRRVHVPPARGKRGRPRKQPAKRGRPRKYPLPSPEELKKPKVWKPLGRPRKYPRVDPPEGVPPAPRRSRGRPRKSASKKGAHLRKSLPTTVLSPRSDGSPRKRGRPPSTPKIEADAPRKKRGRPKGSVNKNKARSETQLDSALSKSDLSAVEAEHKGECLEQKHETDTTTVEHQGDTEEILEQEAGFEVSNQA